MPRQSQGVPEAYTRHERMLAQTMGARIRQRRLHLGLTQEQVRARMELAQVHISRTRYSRIERGENVLWAAEIRALRQVLEVSYLWLLEGEEANQG